MNTQFGDFQTATREHYEKLSASSAAVTRGLQTVVKETTDYSRRSLESATAFGEKLLGAKTFEAAVSLQTEYARSQFEDFIAQMNKVGEIYKAIATDAFQPAEDAVAKGKATLAH